MDHQRIHPAAQDTRQTQRIMDAPPNPADQRHTPGHDLGAGLTMASASSLVSA
jgi:hypothetical protein